MSIPDAFADILREPEVQTQCFSDDGTFPNNEDLPVLVFRHAFRHALRDLDSTMARVFWAHEWKGCWRNGIFSYHHYHSTAHEVLGVTRGNAQIQLGGPEGAAVNVEQGDVLILPAGVAHKNLGATSDFRVVGAYSDGRGWDLNRGRPSERPQADRNIEQVPFPLLDPVYGPDGPLRMNWGSADSLNPSLSLSRRTGAHGRGSRACPPAARSRCLLSFQTAPRPGPCRCFCRRC